MEAQVVLYASCFRKGVSERDQKVNQRMKRTKKILKKMKKVLDKGKLL